MSEPHVMPSDAALPTLPQLFDLPTMTRRFASHFATTPGVPVDVLGCEIERTKYRPGRNCLVAYRLRIRRGAGSSVRRIRVTLAVHAAGEGRRRLVDARARWAAGDGEFGPASGWMDGPGALLWHFPFDRKLAALRDLANGDWLREVALPALATARFGADWRVAGVRTQGVSYFPEHAYTVRAKVHLRTADGARRRVWTIFGKVRDDESGARCFAAMQSLAASHACRGGELGMSLPLQYDSARRILWQEGIDAPTLDACAATAGVRVGWHRIGMAVAALHRQSLGLPVRLAPRDVLAELDRARDRVGAALPSQASTVDALVGRLVTEADSLEDEPSATVHGDLHSRNILLGIDRAFLIDLDRVSTGSPIAELGSLLAEIAFRDCLAGRSLREDACRALFSAYADRVPWRLDPRAVAWHTAAALVRERAYRCVGSLKDGRLAAVPAVLARATRMLDTGVPGLPLQRRITLDLADVPAPRFAWRGA